MKKFIAGLILGLFTAFGTSVLANSTDVLAKFASFNFLVNGETKKLQTQPLVVNGVSYLPVREISNMLGFNVGYDATSRTIKLSNESKTSLSQETSTGTVKETTFNGVKAIKINDQIYFQAHDYNVKLNSISENKGNPENTITFDYETKTSTIYLYGKQLEIPFNDENVKIYNGRTHFHSKFFLQY